MTKDDFSKLLDSILEDTIGEFPLPESELEGVKRAQEKLIKTLYK